MKKYQHLIDFYQNKFNTFTWNNKKQTVGSYRKMFNKLLDQFESSLRKEIVSDIKESLK